MKTGDSQMNEENQNKTATIRGVVTDIRSVPHSNWHSFFRL